MDQTALELANSLITNEIPVRLRCASCNKLCINAFTLPCCSSTICGTCQEELPEACPVCTHTPLPKEHCNPSKNLRLTVKAFLNNEKAKRSKDKTAKPSSDTPTPSAQGLPVKDDPGTATVETTPTVHDSRAQGSSSTDGSQQAPQIAAFDNATSERSTAQEPDVTSALDQSRDSTKSVEPVSQDAAVSSKDHVTAGAKATEQSGQDDHNQNWQSGMTHHQSQNPSGFNGIGMMNGFGNGNWGMGGMNTMMAMQNGMQMQGWNGISNMGMAGLGMDPMMMMSQGIFGNGFGQENMVPQNMNMGMDYQGWNGSSAMGMDGMHAMNGMDGSFGGFYSNGGYNQPQTGNFNPMHQQQYQNNSFHQNRFRGSSNFRRAKNYGYHQMGSSHDSRKIWGEHSGHLNQQSSGNQPGQNGTETQAVQAGDQSLREGEKEVGGVVSVPDAHSVAEEGNVAVDQSTQNPEAHVDETGRKLSEVEHDSKNEPTESIRTDDPKQSDDAPIHVTDVSQRPEGDGSDPTQKLVSSADVEGQTEAADIATKEPASLPSAPSENINIPQGPAAQFPTHPTPFRGRGLTRGLSRAGRGHMLGGIRRQSSGMGMSPMAVPPTAPKGDGVVGAPSGPKAMREGLNNANLRGRGGLQLVTRGAGATIGPGTPNSAAFKPSVSSAKASTDRPRSPSRTRSHSPHRSRHSHPHSKHERGSRSPHDSRDHDHGRHQEQRRRHSTKYDVDANYDDEKEGRRRHSREASIDSQSRHRSSRHHKHHSSHRDRERSREKKRRRHASEDLVDEYNEQNESETGRYKSRHHRDREKYGHGVRNGKSHRSRNRHRSRSPSPRRDGGETYQRDPNHSRSERRDSGRDVPQPPQAPSQPAVREFKIQGRSKQALLEQQQQRQNIPIPTGPRADVERQKGMRREQLPDADAHAREREARNAERLARDGQRRGLQVGLGGLLGERKRSRPSLDTESVNEGSVANQSSSRKNSRKKARLSGTRDGRKCDEDGVFEESAEARATRVEREREAARWD